ncbi:MAG TPA: hypothetical protein VIL14_00075, partial [Nitrososphaeraceae archaeon]
IRRRSSSRYRYRKNDCKMIVTMVAHRGWRPDDKTVYYIATYATPKTPADMIGEPYVKSDEKLIGMPVVVDLFQFTTGINGSGLLEMYIL